MMNPSWKRSICTLALLFCFGLAVPAVGGSVHVCLSEWFKSDKEKTCCCDSAPSEQHQSPCCIELEELPDAQPPSPTITMPDAPEMHLDWFSILPPRAKELTSLSHSRHIMIRGPDSPTSFRAILEIWRL